MLRREDGSAFVPMGDAILSLPIAKEGGFQLLVPNAFVAELLQPLTDVKIVREIPEGARVLHTKEPMFDPASPFNVAKWGTKEMLDAFGPVNATLCWAMSLGYRMRDPVPRLSRPRGGEPGKVGLFANGTVPKRSIPEWKLEEIASMLSRNGFSPEPCPFFERPSDLADFVASCEYTVGVYTGPIHLAAAMGVKTVAIPAGDSALAYRPLQSNVFVLAPPCDACWFSRLESGPSCKEPRPKCVRSVLPESVLSAMRSLDAGQGGFEYLQDPA